MLRVAYVFVVDFIETPDSVQLLLNFAVTCRLDHTNSYINKDDLSYQK